MIILEDRQAALAPALKRCRFLVETGINIPAACRRVSLPSAEALIADCVTYRDERRGVRKPHGPSESAALLPMSAYRAWLVRLCGHERFRRPATSVLPCADLGWVETDKSCACALQGLLRNLDIYSSETPVVSSLFSIYLHDRVFVGKDSVLGFVASLWSCLMVLERDATLQQILEECRLEVGGVGLPRVID